MVLQTKHLDHTIEMVNKEKIRIKKNIFYHNNKHVTSKRLSVRVFFFFFDILHHFAIQLLAPYPPRAHYPPQNHSCYALIITQGTFYF